MSGEPFPDAVRDYVFKRIDEISWEETQAMSDFTPTPEQIASGNRLAALRLASTYAEDPAYTVERARLYAGFLDGKPAVKSSSNAG